ncbi:MAG: hypothetical protein M3302_02500, partial [Actinomycetota bacterium]|nr:hypothetical protein [Actinomycetota bacterium]
MPVRLHRIPRCSRALAVLLLAVLLGGCTAGPSDRPAVAVRDSNLQLQRPVEIPPSATPLPAPG